MRSVSEHYTPAGKHPECEGSGCGLYTTWTAASAFHVNRLDWIYSTNASFISAAHDRGVRTVSLAMNPSLPDDNNISSSNTGRATTAIVAAAAAAAAPSRSSACNDGAHHTAGAIHRHGSHDHDHDHHHHHHHHHGHHGHHEGSSKTLRDMLETRNVDRILNVHLEKLTAPWMRTWDTKPYYGCINGPNYLAIAYRYAARLVSMGANAIQHDDPTANGEAVAWNNGDPNYSGCYCQHCMRGFNAALHQALNASELKSLNVTSDFDYRLFVLANMNVSSRRSNCRSGGALSCSLATHTAPSAATTAATAAACLLRKLFVQFQQNSTRQYITNLRAHTDAVAGRHIAFSCNNGDRGFISPYDLFDYGVGELSMGAATPGGLMDIFAAAAATQSVEGPRQQIMTMPKSANISAADVYLIRWSIAYAYSLGGLMMVPWDIYLPSPSARRYYGSAHQYADLYGFVRAQAALLDAHAKRFGQVNLTESFVLAHTGMAGDGARWRLPTDTPPAAGRTNGGAGGLGGCAWACTGDEKCVGMYVGRNTGGSISSCSLLYELILIQGTALDGRSYNRTGNAPLPALRTSAGGAAVQLQGRETEADTVSQGLSRAIHITDYRYATSGGVLQPPLNITVNASLVRAPAGATFTTRLLTPNTSNAVVLQARYCAETETYNFDKVPAPRPWSMLQFDYAKEMLAH